MSAPHPTATEVLDRVFLEVRCKLLDAAACLDRIARSEGGDRTEHDRRMQQIRAAIEILNSPGVDRAERIQLLFSDAYVAGWMQGLKTGNPGPTLAGRAFQETV